MRVEIRKLHKRLGTTSIYVTHDQLEAMTLADRLVVMNGGRIEQIGTPIEVYERPETLFVAGFIGSPPMNLIEVGPGAGVSDWPPLPASTDLVGLRPDALRLQAPEGPGVAFTGVVELIEPIGGESHVHIGLEGMRQPIIASLPGRTGLTEGSTATWFARSADLHPFNAESGLRTD
jgi:sn-glycerol 3-phosphate transport system ATP-binding protein